MLKNNVSVVLMGVLTYYTKRDQKCQIMTQMWRHMIGCVISYNGNAVQTVENCIKTKSFELYKQKTVRSQSNAYRMALDP